MNPDQNFSKTERILQEGLQNEAFSAAQVAWSAGNASFGTICVGNTESGPVTETTRFDIASLTKVFAASAALRLFSREHIPLETPLSTWIPLAAGFAQATLSHLLSHEAGFAAWQPFFESIPLYERGTPSARESIIRRVIQSPCECRPGTKAVYSDLGYIILLEILEKISNRNLRETIRNEVSLPLELTQSDFLPLGNTREGEKTDIAPTEYCRWRQKRLVGEVHDDNAWSMGGVAAHAGVFSTALEIAKLGDAWLKTIHDGHWLPRSIAKIATQRRPSGRGIGWDLKSGSASSAGLQMSERTFGHLGYTGCSLWADPAHNVSVALLTNRVYFGRENTKIRSFRPVLYDSVLDELRSQSSELD